MVKLSKNVFLMTVAMILGLYGVANVMLFYMRGGWGYFDNDLFILITAVFAFMIILILPRTVLIVLGGERKPPKSEVINYLETSDPENTPQN
jgi:hypothetical protein